MESRQEFIDQIVEDYGYSVFMAGIAAYLYEDFATLKSWQEAWERFCQVENQRA